MNHFNIAARDLPKREALFNPNGQPCCPFCSSPGVWVPLVGCRGPLAGRAMGCTNNRYSGGRASGCLYMYWLKNASNFAPRPEVPRPADWPRITKRTAEQVALRAALAVAPGSPVSWAAVNLSGGPTSKPTTAPRPRCIVVNAVPGSGKSTSMADDCEVIHDRFRGCLADWYLAAFNVNAKDSLLGKIPAHWNNIQTINGFGMRLQGFGRKHIKPGKVGTIFRDLISAIDPKERPSAAGVKAFADRLRDQLLYTDSAADPAWERYLTWVRDRFPGLDKAWEKNSDAIRSYLPQVLTRAQSDRNAIDLTEQYCRPALEAIRATGWRQRQELTERAHEWTTADLEHMAALIRKIQVPQVRGVIVDEAQDLSLSQMVLFLAATFRSGELVLVGDDRAGEPGEPIYKAGQAIFGWRGAMPGSLRLVARLWHHLTGETPADFPLSVTFRCPPEICDAVRPLNQVMVSAKPRGTGEVASVSEAEAYDRWLNIPETNRDGKPFAALWITRRNAPIADLFMQTLKDRKKVCLRGGGDMESAVNGVLMDAAGWRDDNEEYRTSLKDCINKLRELIAEQVGDETPAAANVDSMEQFILTIAEEIAEDPALLREAELPAVASVGNLRKFVLYFASKDAPRVLSTVYRSKGDEADLVIVSDCESLNTAWNNDADEASACRHVAATRSRQSLLICGSLAGVIVPAGGVSLAAEVAAEVERSNPTPRPTGKDKPPAPVVKPAAPSKPEPRRSPPAPVGKPFTMADIKSAIAAPAVVKPVGPLPIPGITDEPAPAPAKRPRTNAKPVAENKPAKRKPSGPGLF